MLIQCIAQHYTERGVLLFGLKGVVNVRGHAFPVRLAVLECSVLSFDIPRVPIYIVCVVVVTEIADGTMVRRALCPDTFCNEGDGIRPAAWKCVKRGSNVHKSCVMHGDE